MAYRFLLPARAAISWRMVRLSYRSKTSVREV